jgi:hypothetical protein
MMALNPIALTFSLLLALASHVAAAQTSSGNDLRDIRIGMSAADLPDTGYIGFACASDASRKLSGWSGWHDCPSDADGLHAIHFGFDPETSRDGTVVAGHPVILTALVDEKGDVAGLKIDTETEGPLYVRKKAFLLGVQVKSRYGADGWICTQAQPQAGEQPVGGVFLRESCSKTISGRSIIVQRNLFRRANQDEKSFVNETRISILRSKS